MKNLAGFTLFEMLLYIALTTMLMSGIVFSAESLSLISQSMQKDAVSKDQTLFQFEDEDSRNIEL